MKKLFLIFLVALSLHAFAISDINYNNYQNGGNDAHEHGGGHGGGHGK